MAEFSSGMVFRRILGGGGLLSVGKIWGVLCCIQEGGSVYVDVLGSWGTNTGSVFKTYPPNFKGFQEKTTQKWCFFNPYLLEFGSR